MLTNLRLLVGLLWQPLTALRQLRDRAPVGFAVVVAWLAAILYALVGSLVVAYAQGGARVRGGQAALGALIVGDLFSVIMRAGMIVLFVAVVYVPFIILLANLFERRASFSLVLREEYAATVSCTLLSLAVALLITLLPALIIGWQSAWLPSTAVIAAFVLLTVMPLPIFAALMTLTVGTIFRIGWVAAVGTTLLSFLSLIALPLVMQATMFICGFPFLLIILFFLLRDRMSDFMRSHQARQAFKQNLENATLNPADASSHYNLGLLYQQRGELDAAVNSFRRAVEIDPSETDAHYQLGRIAREQGRLDEAVKHFEQVVQQNPTHQHHEIWRETALVYYAARQYPDALAMLDRFLQERPSDAQGHYWRGMTLHQLGRPHEALEEMQSCVETVKTAPAYKYRTERQWLHLAQTFLRERQS
jgi:tetratricopeptide (TPR) repeat protein